MIPPPLLSACSIGMLAAAVTLPASAQTGARTIALTRSARVMLHDPATCRFASCTLTPLLPSAAVSPRAGGAAIDLRDVRPRVWISDGQQVEAVEVPGCTVVCGPFQPDLGGETITGLAMLEARGQLLVSTAAGAIWTVRADCPWEVVSRCDLSTVLGNNATIGGLAIDDASGRLLVGVSLPQLGSPAHSVLVSSASSPCRPLCQWSLSACSPGQTLTGIQGLAWDPCTATCSVTDGNLIATYRVGDLDRCAARLIGCCADPAPERLIGLTALPSLPTEVGRGCAPAACNGCTPRHAVVGLPLVGGSIQLRISGAPPGASAFLALGAGPCLSPGIRTVACGPVHVALGPPPPVVIGPLPLAGAGPCGGSHAFTLPIPPLPALCGAVLSSQHLVLCSGSLQLGSTGCSSWAVISP